MDKRLQGLYSRRFHRKEREEKEAVWKEICAYLEQFASKGRQGCVVDVAAGYCEFINHFRYGKKKYAVDANPDIVKYARGGVKPVVDGIHNLSSHFKEGTVSLFFMSNFLEHIPRKDISELLETEYRLLQPGGQVWILTPNIRYVGGKYWDFYDHITPVTEKSLIEAAGMAGYRLETCIPKFLPFTTKGRLPKARWAVRLYLKLMPLSGMFFGEQSFLIFSKKKEKA